MPKHDISRAFKEDDTEVYIKTHSDGVFIDEDELTTLTNYINDSKFESATGTTTNIIVNMLDLYNGYSKSFIAYANNNGQATKINGKPLYKPNTTDAPNIIEGKAYTVWYDTIRDCFFLKASAEGNATAENVLADKKFSNDNDTGITGTMPNRGAINKTLGLNETYTIPEGYHNGSGKVTQSITTKGAITDSVSNVVSGDSLYTRIPQSAYFTNATSGYPEIKTSVSSLTSVLQSASQSIKENIITKLDGFLYKTGSVTWNNTGGYKATKGYYSGTNDIYSLNDSYPQTNTINLGFVPQMMIIFNESCNYSGTLVTEMVFAFQTYCYILRTPIRSNNYYISEKVIYSENDWINFTKNSIILPLPNSDTIYTYYAFGK